MSTDLHDRRTSAAPNPRDPQEQKPSGSLSPAQVVGGALAAMTAAFLGSKLSVAGTVIGAAIASVVAAVGGSVYTASLRQTHERVSQVWKGRTRPGPDPQPAATARPSEPEPEFVAQPTPVARPRISWKAVVAGSLATFAIAGLALTGFELATGQALSGGQGTTISQVADPRGSGPAVTEPTTSATPTLEPTPTPSTGPSATPSETASPAPTPSESATPTQTPTPAASSTPSSVATQTPAAAG